MTIHSGHPFADESREPARQFRSRLGGRVTLWSAGVGRERAGLTVSSLMVCGGELWRVLGLLHPDADLVDSLQQTGRATIALLSSGDAHLAEAFAGLAPAPGGPFRLADFAQTAWGPVPPGDTWLGVRLESLVEVGWSLLATCVIEHAVIGADAAPLHHTRGEYRS